MTFRIVISASLEGVLGRLRKKDKARFLAVMNKILKISECDGLVFQHFKNLRGRMSHLKRVHIGSFVLMFRVEGDTVIFENLTHHDDSYGN